MKFSAIPQASAWKNLYTVAVLEDDHAKVAGRIAAAETAIVRRGRMLFDLPGNHAHEAEALDLALRRLRLLRALPPRSSAGDSLQVRVAR
jgi:hypothetical protein